jgi:hypothetical protein
MCGFGYFCEVSIGNFIHRYPGVMALLPSAGFVPSISLLWIIPLSLILTTASAQKTLVYGRVTEASTGSPVAFANIAFKGTLTGTSSDELGNFTLETTERYDRLYFSAIGYKDTVIPIRVHERQEIRVSLYSTDYQLGEVVIKAGENPAFEILRKVIAAKPVNDPARYDAYEYQSYNKVQFDLNNFSDKIKKNFLFRPFPFIWQYQDTMANGVRYLPFLFKENVRDHYYRRQPAAYREYISGDRQVQFFRGPKIEKFIEEMYLNPEVYNNFVVILNKSFPSPINDQYKRFYKFILDDTLRYIDGLPCHHLRFYPKGESDVAFTGEMYIHDSTFAVKRMDLNFSIEANINFVRSFWIRLEYDWLEQRNWFIKSSTVLADFTVVENSPELTGFFGRRFSEYKNIVINQPRPDSIYAPVDPVIVADSAALRNEDFWVMQRSDTLSEEEKNIVALVDTIRDNWKFKFFKSAFTTVGSGWAPIRNLEYGNIWTFLSYNDIEGMRIKAGFRTPYKSTWRLQPRGYLAYGTNDQRFKFYAELNWVFNKQPGKYMLIGGAWQEDAEQLGRSYYAIPIDHFLTYWLQTAPFDTRTFVKNKVGYVERQWFMGFVTRAAVFSQEVAPFGDYHFYEVNESGGTTPVDRFRLAGVRLTGRYAYGEKEVHARFYDPESRFFMNKRPVVSFDYLWSKKGMMDSEFSYQRASVRVEHQQKMNRWGYLHYLVEGGQLWGEVPYTFLAIPFGNQAILADRASFGMMNYLEFASDQYLTVHLEHHFEGLFFNRIPFIRKLKLREFLLARTFIGNLSDKNNQQQWLFPERLHAIGDPYVEVGFGIENILKLGRIDFMWRLNYLDHNDVYRFLPKPSFQFRF